jgi:hypothetical protein
VRTRRRRRSPADTGILAEHKELADEGELRAARVSKQRRAPVLPARGRAGAVQEYGCAGSVRDFQRDQGPGARGCRVEQRDRSLAPGPARERARRPGARRSAHDRAQPPQQRRANAGVGRELLGQGECLPDLGTARVGGDADEGQGVGGDERGCARIRTGPPEAVQHDGQHDHDGAQRRQRHADAPRSPCRRGRLRPARLPRWPNLHGGPPLPGARGGQVAALGSLDEVDDQRDAFQPVALTEPVLQEVGVVPGYSPA